MTEGKLKDLKYDLKMMAFESEVFDTESMRERINELFEFVNSIKE